MTDDESCSDCKLEIIESIWTHVLLNWLNQCVYKRKEQIFNLKSLKEMICRYKEDICRDDIDKTLLTTNLEEFVKYKFPILRLRNLEYDIQSKYYILTSVLLYYCCTNTRGQVDADICKNLHEEEQIFIVKFCEMLSDMEVTVNNVKSAIKGAFTYLKQENINKIKPKINETESDLTESSSQIFSSIKSDPQKIQFKSSITVLPSVVNDFSRLDFSDDSVMNTYGINYLVSEAKDIGQVVQKNSSGSSEEKSASNHYCQPDCACSRCSPTGPCCGDAGCTKDLCDSNEKHKKFDTFSKKKYGIIIGSILLVLLLLFLCTIPLWLMDRQESLRASEPERRGGGKGYSIDIISQWAWQCKNSFCHKVLISTSNLTSYPSLSQCTLLCTGPQLWPYPIGFKHFSKTIITLSTNKMEYKFLSIPSDAVQQFIAEAFKLFLQDLAKLEKNIPKKHRSHVLKVNKMYIQIKIESDTDPMLRINTDESYNLKVDTLSTYVLIQISSVSFCGARHGLETLIQLLLLDESTGYIITLSNVIIQDAPTYKYRGLMVDTVHHFIPITNLMKTVDAMSYCKFNTFHWRMDVTSFPVDKKDLFEYGPCDKSMIYSIKDIEFVVKRARARGIRVLIEVAMIGPTRGPLMMINSPICTKNTNYTASASVQKTILDLFQEIYSIILQITKTNDIFHLGQNVFSMLSCYNMGDIDFIDNVLYRLKLANKGFLPKWPILWYNSQWTDLEETWPRYVVQLNDLENPNINKFKVIHSTKWDLSCEIRHSRCTKYRTWQQMYSWLSWRNIESLSIEGGEAILWSDLVDSSNKFHLKKRSKPEIKGVVGNLDLVLWPRAAAVAERLWSDMVINSSVNKFVYVRLDAHRSRMLRQGVNVQAIWPSWCTLNPTSCFEKIH